MARMYPKREGSGVSCRALSFLLESAPSTQSRRQFLRASSEVKQQPSWWSGGEGWGRGSVLCVRKVKSTIDSGTPQREQKNEPLCWAQLFLHAETRNVKTKLQAAALLLSYSSSLHAVPNYANIRALKEHQILVGGVLTSRSNPAMFTQGAWEILRFQKHCKSNIPP